MKLLKHIVSIILQAAWFALCLFICSFAVVVTVGKEVPLWITFFGGLCLVALIVLTLDRKSW